MARYKKRTIRASPRRSYKKVSAKRRSSSKGGKLKIFQIDSMAYGALRGYTSQLLAPLTAKIPLGDIADEVVMGFANYMIAKNTSGMIKDVALKGLTIENARLGEAVISGGLGSLTRGTGSTTEGFIYG